jgi:uncharacterized protein YbjT (DUF2867 family)
MNILILGGKGFLGRHIDEACRAYGYRTLLGVHRADVMHHHCDFADSASGTVEFWRARLDKVDAVINCVGVLHAPASEMGRVHRDAPAALATACAEAKKSLLHISVLGLDQVERDTPYFRSKREGEDAIRRAYPGAIIVRPSLVYGPDGPVSQMLVRQSRLPVLCALADSKAVAPIHVDDVASLCAVLIGTLRALGCDVDAVGPDEMMIEDLLQAFRAARAEPPAKVMHIPNHWVRAGMNIASRFGAKMMVPEALDLLEHRHTGDARAFVRWMRRPPKAVSGFRRQPAAATI